VKKLLVFAAMALVVPSLALAAKPPSPGTSAGTHGKSAPKVMYVLKGTFSNFTAATATTNGTVTLTVTHSNFHAKTLVTAPPTALTINVSSKTKLVMHPDAHTISNGDHGVVELRAPLHPTATGLITAITTMPTVAAVVIDQGS
jgi:hypothetical protein